MFDDNKVGNKIDDPAADISEEQQEVAQVLGENKSEVANGKPNQQTVVIKDEDIHSMPVKFLPNKPQQAANKASVSSGKGGGGKKIVWVFVGLIVFLGVIIGGGLWFINSYNKPPVDQGNNVNQGDVVSDNTNTEDNTNTNTNTNDNVNTNTNTNTNDNVSPPPPPPTSALDADNDGLTQLEEGIYFTNSNRDDTDRDNYKDGVEVSNLYNPLVPGEGEFLVDSGLVTKYADASGYNLLRPKNWVAEASEEHTVIFIPDAGTGELISLLAMPNENNISLDTIFSEIPDLLQPRADYVNFSLADQPALKTIDGFGVLMVTEAYIYIIDYDLGGVSQPNFSTTFGMMLRSFTLGEKDDDMLNDEQ